MRYLAWLLAIVFLTGCGSPEEVTYHEPPVHGEAVISTAKAPQVKIETKPAKFYSDKDLASSRRKVKKLISRGNAMWLLHGEATDDAAMCFLILRRDWKTFTNGERAALRPIIEEQIVDLKANPSKYAATQPGSALWSHVLGKIQGAYPAVMLSDRRVGPGDFEMSERINNFDAQPMSENPKPAEPAVADTRALDQQLMSAISGDNVSKVRQLLKKGASPNAKWDSNGMPALIAAATGGNLQIVKLLVEKGADVSATDSTFGWTALEFAQNELRNEQDNPGKYEAVIRYLESR